MLLYLLLLAVGSSLGLEETAGPVFVHEPPNRVDFSNTTGTVVLCSARGNPPPDIIWVRSDGTAVGDVPGLRHVLANGNLVFPPFRAEDYRQEVHAQVYACLAKNTEGQVHSRDVNVRGVVSQEYTTNVMDVNVLKGNTAIFKCHIPSFVSDYVTVTSWLQDDGHEILSQDDSKYLVLPSGELHIKHVGPVDSYKSYQCRTKHRLTGETRLSDTKGRLVIIFPARTASFDDVFTTTYKEDVTLPCLAVGVPIPVITWTIKGVKFSANSNDRIRQQRDGSLFIRDVMRTDAGEYSCKVENDYGQDSVTHQLIVNAPPQVTLTSTTTNSLTIKLKPHDTDGEPIHNYTIHYKPEFGEWETVQIGPNIDSYTIDKLLCGTRYQLYVTSYNSIGTGDSSDNLNAKTQGEKPIEPSAEKFIEVSSNSIVLHLSAWSDGGCPILYFVLEHKKKSSTEWILVSNNVKPSQNFVLLDLDPAQWYHLRVTAHNNAGFNVAEYEFTTLTVTGGLKKFP